MVQVAAELPTSFSWASPSSNAVALVKGRHRGSRPVNGFVQWLHFLCLESMEGVVLTWISLKQTSDKGLVVIWLPCTSTLKMVLTYWESHSFPIVSRLVFLTLLLSGICGPERARVTLGSHS